MWEDEYVKVRSTQLFFSTCGEIGNVFTVFKYPLINPLIEPADLSPIVICRFYQF